MRIGNYGITTDNFNFILTTYGQKTHKVGVNEAPKEVVKNTGYYSTFDSLLKGMANEELLKQVAAHDDLVMAYTEVYGKLIRDLIEFKEEERASK